MTLRTLAPAAAPLSAVDLLSGLAGWLRPEAAIARLEREFAETLGVRHVFFFSSARAGLTVLLRALRTLRDRQSVIMPAYTCFALPAAVHKAGLHVQPCDIDAGTFDFDFDALEALVIRTSPLAVVSTHLFGCPANVARARAICEAHGAFLIDDAAQALGIGTESGYLGTLGNAGLYSFARGKGVTAVNGGAVVTSDDALAAELKRQRSIAHESQGHGRALRTLAEAAAMTLFIHPTLYWLPASLPFLHLGGTEYSTEFSLEMMSGTQAGLLRRWRRRLEESNAVRAAHAEKFAAIAKAAAGPCLRLPLVCTSQASRDRLYEAGSQAGLGFSLMYPTSIDAIPEVRAGIGSEEFPIAQSLAERLLTIPVHPLLSDRDCEAISAMLSSAGPTLVST